MRFAKIITIIYVLGVSYLCQAGCGWGGPSYQDFYDVLFGDNNRPQLYDGKNKANIKAWGDYFTDKYVNIEEIVYEYSQDQIRTLIVKEKKKKNKAGLQYLLYAKKLQDVSSRFSGDSRSWNYYDILETHDYNQEIVNEGIKAFKKVKNKELKLRYAYQIIRYYHYSKKYKKAIDFFESSVKNIKHKTELYYYCLDQVSGCYFSLKKYTEAGYGFMRVYLYSIDRKTSAMNSFNIYYDWNYKEIAALCQNDKEKAFAKTLVSDNYYNLSDAEWILQHAYDEEALSSIYYYHDIHEEGRRYWLNKENYSYFNYNDQDNVTWDKNIELINKIIQHPKTKQQDFWHTTLAYLHYLKGDFNEANNQMSNLSYNNGLNKGRFTFFKEYFTIANKPLNDKTENQFYSFYEKHIIGQKGMENTFRVDMFFTMLKLYYYHHNASLKADLIVLSKDQVDQIYDIEQLTKLKELWELEDKNKMEAYLLQTTFGNTLNVTDYINEKFGSYFLMIHNYTAANLHFKLLPKDYKVNLTSYFGTDDNYQFDGYSNIPAYVFSTNYTEGFQFPMTQILTDKTFRKKKFSFIKEEFNKQELAKYIAALKKMELFGDADAAFLLGNYYYNTSKLGYFRNILIYYSENNACLSCHTHKLLDEYNKLSYEYYEAALTKEEEKEQKAKITYCIAKNVAYDNVDYYNMDKDSPKYHDLFNALESEYRTTRFYKEIIKECSQFAYYSSNIFTR